MLSGMNRRNFLQIGLTAGAVAILPRAMSTQSTPAAHLAAGPDEAAGTPVKSTRLYDNLYLLQGVGGNMALQTGVDGNIVIDSSFAGAVPHILETITGISKDAPFALINTHWHSDHTGGNEGLHTAGFHVIAHQNTRERLSHPQTMKMFNRTTPASPAGALPTITFDDELQLWHNGDSLDLVHFKPAHTDTDIYIHFHNADVLHVGDVWFNGIYPFIDEGTGGSIGGMIRAGEKALEIAGNDTKILPGHGPLGSKADFQNFHDMLSTVRDKVAKLKTGGANEQEAIAKKPTAEFDSVWGNGFMSPDVFTGIVYRTL